VKLLVTGGAGFLGRELCALAVARGDDVIATQLHREPPHGRPIRLDVRDAAAVDRLILRHGPDAVIHTAYVQHGDAMEDTIVRGSHAVAEAARRCGARLVHLSSDLVFDGEQGAPYTESAEPRPVLAYGQAKLDAEQLVLRAHPSATVVRTSLLYGRPDGPQEQLALRDDVTFYTDEIRCPTRVDELAAALLELLELDHAGPLHLAAPAAVSRYELARVLRRAAGADSGGVAGAPSPRDGRPRNVALDSARASTLLRTRLAPIGRSA
jgi:dTDP-4-dehydrorhamnose reductase